MIIVLYCTWTNELTLKKEMQDSKRQDVGGVSRAKFLALNATSQMNQMKAIQHIGRMKNGELE